MCCFSACLLQPATLKKLGIFFFFCIQLCLCSSRNFFSVIEALSQPDHVSVPDCSRSPSEPSVGAAITATRAPLTAIHGTAQPVRLDISTGSPVSTPALEEHTQSSIEQPVSNSPEFDAGPPSILDDSDTVSVHPLPTPPSATFPWPRPCREDTMA